VQSALQSCPAGKEARPSHSRPRRRRRRSWTRRTSPSSRGRKPRRPLSRPRATRLRRGVLLVAASRSASCPFSSLPFLAQWHI
ncbi:hypothetical protein BD310DRAFT_1034337, partial [Dichomitus squalens]